MASHSPANLPSAVTAGLRYRNLGKSGLRVPNIGLGLWSSIDEDTTEDIVTVALENGINLFDLSEAHNGNIWQWTVIKSLMSRESDLRPRNPSYCLYLNKNILKQMALTPFSCYGYTRTIVTQNACSWRRMFYVNLICIEFSFTTY